MPKCVKMEIIFLILILIVHVSNECQVPQIANGDVSVTKTSASVSCNAGYRLKPPISILTCQHVNGNYGTWTPIPPSCVVRATSTYISETNAIEPTSVMSDTKTDIPTTAYVTTSSVRPTFESHISTSEPQRTEILSSEFISDVIASTTHITASGYSTEIPTIVSTTIQTLTSISASTQSVPALSQEDKGSDVNPAYIAVPVVICVIAIIVVVLFLLWRRKKSVPTVSKREKGPGSSLKNKAYDSEVKAIDRYCSLINVRKSCDSGYAEIRLDFRHPEEAPGNVYQTIDSLPEDHIGNTNNYDHLKQQTTKFIDMNYSHIKTNTNGKQLFIDTTYAHTKTSAESKESKDSSDDGNATYNRLDTASKATTGKYVTEGLVKGDTEPEYNHARAGCPDPENDADDYSHLNGLKQTPHTSTQKEKYRQYHEKKRGTNHPEVEPYEFAKEPENPQYEFARDVDKLNSANNSRYAQSVGNTNNYFILEAEEESASNDVSFRVVEGFPQEMADTTEHADQACHEYFVLEKTET